MFKQICFVTSMLMGMMHASMPVYENQITDITEIHGASTYTVVLHCTNSEPIAVYAPATYQESQDFNIVRLFMPQTTIADGVVSDVLQSVGDGVEILLFGTLRSKIIGDHQLILVVDIQ